MRVLWLGNIVLSDFCEEFRIKKTMFGGWMEGLYREIRSSGACELAVACGIRDAARRHDGVHDGIRYYAFDASHDDMLQDDAACGPMVADFLRILDDFQPEVVHIFGTEYPHAWAMLEACRRRGMEHRIVCHLQGVLSFIQQHYASGLPEAVLHAVDFHGNSIARDIAIFRRQAVREKEILRHVGFVLGRTFWDASCARVLNPDVRYRFCEEILRPSFYAPEPLWDVRTCERHTLFLSQAGYPVKGFHWFLPALQILKGWYPDIRVTVSGGNPMQVDADGHRTSYGAYLYDLATRLGVLDRITFTGPLAEEEMRAQFLRAHVFVSSSNIENSPNSVAEAMMLGVPVVASDVGGLATLITQGVSGWLYQADAPYMRAAYVRRVFVDDALASALSVPRDRNERVRLDASDPAAVSLICLSCEYGSVVPAIAVFETVHAPDDGALIDKYRSALHKCVCPFCAVCAVFPADAVRFQRFSASQAKGLRHPFQPFFTGRTDPRNSVVCQKLFLHFAADRAAARK